MEKEDTPGKTPSSMKEASGLIKGKGREKLTTQKTVDTKAIGGMIKEKGKVCSSKTKVQSEFSIDSNFQLIQINLFSNIESYDFKVN